MKKKRKPKKLGRAWIKKYAAFIEDPIFFKKEKGPMVKRLVTITGKLAQDLDATLKANDLLQAQLENLQKVQSRLCHMIIDGGGIIDHFIRKTKELDELSAEMKKVAKKYPMQRFVDPVETEPSAEESPQQTTEKGDAHVSEPHEPD